MSTETNSSDEANGGLNGHAEESAADRSTPGNNQSSGSYRMEQVTHGLTRPYQTVQRHFPPSYFAARNLPQPRIFARARPVATGPCLHSPEQSLLHLSGVGITPPIPASTGGNHSEHLVDGGSQSATPASNQQGVRSLADMDLFAPTTNPKSSPIKKPIVLSAAHDLSGSSAAISLPINPVIGAPPQAQPTDEFQQQVALFSQFTQFSHLFGQAMASSQLGLPRTPAAVAPLSMLQTGFASSSGFSGNVQSTATAVGSPAVSVGVPSSLPSNMIQLPDGSITTVETYKLLQRHQREDAEAREEMTQRRLYSGVSAKSVAKQAQAASSFPGHLFDKRASLPLTDPQLSTMAASSAAADFDNDDDNNNGFADEADDRSQPESTDEFVHVAIKPDNTLRLVDAPPPATFPFQRQVSTSPYPGPAALQIAPPSSSSTPHVDVSQQVIQLAEAKAVVGEALADIKDESQAESDAESYTSEPPYNPQFKRGAPETNELMYNHDVCANDADYLDDEEGLKMDNPTQSDELPDGFSQIPHFTTPIPRIISATSVTEYVIGVTREEVRRYEALVKDSVVVRLNAMARPDLPHNDRPPQLTRSEQRNDAFTELLTDPSKWDFDTPLPKAVKPPLILRKLPHLRELSEKPLDQTAKDARDLVGFVYSAMKDKAAKRNLKGYGRAANDLDWIIKEYPPRFTKVERAACNEAETFVLLDCTTTYRAKFQNQPEKLRDLFLAFINPRNVELMDVKKLFKKGQVPLCFTTPNALATEIWQRYPNLHAFWPKYFEMFENNHSKIVFVEFDLPFSLLNPHQKVCYMAQSNRRHFLGLALGTEEEAIYAKSKVRIFGPPTALSEEPGRLMTHDVQLSGRTAVISIGAGFVTRVGQIEHQADYYKAEYADCPRFDLHFKKFYNPQRLVKTDPSIRIGISLLEPGEMFTTLEGTLTMQIPLGPLETVNVKWPAASLRTLALIIYEQRRPTCVCPEHHKAGDIDAGMKACLKAAWLNHCRDPKIELTDEWENACFECGWYPEIDYKNNRPFQTWKSRSDALTNHTKATWDPKTKVPRPRTCLSPFGLLSEYKRDNLIACYFHRQAYDGGMKQDLAWLNIDLPPGVKRHELRAPNKPKNDETEGGCRKRTHSLPPDNKGQGKPTKKRNKSPDPSGVESGDEPEIAAILPSSSKRSKNRAEPTASAKTSASAKSSKKVKAEKIRDQDDASGDPPPTCAPTKNPSRKQQRSDSSSSEDPDWRPGGGGGSVRSARKSGGAARIRLVGSSSKSASTPKSASKKTPSHNKKASSTFGHQPNEEASADVSGSVMFTKAMYKRYPETSDSGPASTLAEMKEKLLQEQKTKEWLQRGQDRREALFRRQQGMPPAGGMDKMTFNDQLEANRKAKELQRIKLAKEKQQQFREREAEYEQRKQQKAAAAATLAGTSKTTSAGLMAQRADMRKPATAERRQKEDEERRQIGEALKAKMAQQTAPSSSSGGTGLMSRDPIERQKAWRSWDNHPAIIERNNDYDAALAIIDNGNLVDKPDSCESESEDEVVQKATQKKKDVIEFDEEEAAAGRFKGNLTIA